MSNDFYREQIMRASAIHGGVGQQDMLTPSSVQKTEANAKVSERLNALVAEAIKKGMIKENDILFSCLLNFFLTEAHTAEGKERALRMAIGTAQRLNKEFTFEKR